MPEAYELVPEAPPTVPSFKSEDDIKAAWARFQAQHTRPEQVLLISLGYGPFGADDPNFNPVFRRRYYLTFDELETEFRYLAEHYDDLYTEENQQRLDTFLLDSRWWLKNRKDIREGSIPAADRRGA